ncbi:glycosyltransferase family 39 protein [Microbacterium cremeum]|uniref:glycosyltransferase family 39 protein n=1 Tax=Microbacterium cremeum TaxID=2782169 RepID=UPI001889BC72|nr:glycosyltransferase family 39 protein [Microbacterium cremeum]
MVVVALITAAFIAMMMLWAMLTPIFGAPDEQAHVNSAVRLTGGLDWPPPGEARMSQAMREARLQTDVPAANRATLGDLMSTYPGLHKGIDQMTQHPPLYYLYGAGVLRVIDYEDRRIDHAILALRLAGIVWLAPLPLLVWDSVRRLTRSPKAAIVGAAALLAVPQLAHITSAVTSDGLVVALSSVVVWLSIRVMTGERRIWAPLCMGLALGGALLTKGTALPLAPFAVAVLLWWPRDLSRGRRVARAVVATVVASAIGGWWWVRNLVLYRDLQPSGLAGGRPTAPWAEGTGPDIVAFMELMWDRATQSFWGAFGRLEFGLPEPLTDVLTVLAILMVVAGFASHGPKGQRMQMAFLASLPLLLSAMLFVNTWRHYVRTQIAGGLQGRYFFVIIIAMIALSAVAWYRAVPTRKRTAVGVILLAVFAGVAVLGVFREYIGVYEDSLYRITREGLRALATFASAGVATTAATGLVAGGLLVAMLIASIRFVRATASVETSPGPTAISDRTRGATSPAEPARSRA